MQRIVLFTISFKITKSKLNVEWDVCIKLSFSTKTVGKHGPNDDDPIKGMQGDDKWVITHGAKGCTWILVSYKPFDVKPVERILLHKVHKGELRQKSETA